MLHLQHICDLIDFLSTVDPTTAYHMAQAQIYKLLGQQATLWDYVETFRYYAVAVILILSFVYFLAIQQETAKIKKINFLPELRHIFQDEPNNPLFLQYP